MAKTIQDIENGVLLSEVNVDDDLLVTVTGVETFAILNEKQN